jgi:hypothetical protein
MSALAIQMVVILTDSGCQSFARKLDLGRKDATTSLFSQIVVNELGPRLFLEFDDMIFDSNSQPRTRQTVSLLKLMLEGRDDDDDEVKVEENERSSSSSSSYSTSSDSSNFTPLLLPPPPCSNARSSVWDVHSLSPPPRISYPFSQPIMMMTMADTSSSPLTLTYYSTNTFSSCYNNTNNNNMSTTYILQAAIDIVNTIPTVDDDDDDDDDVDDDVTHVSNNNRP